MTSTHPSKRDDRLFVRDGRRACRRRYSVNEARAGLVIMLLLVAVAGWIAWRGANPDPELFDVSAALLDPGSPAAGRGPLPSGLAAPGWHATAASHFDPENLYEKIDGREAYYKSFGFERLDWVSIQHDEDPGTAVDIELFDLGRTPNALGAYAGERPPDVAPAVDRGSMWHLARNALFMARGRYYLRAVGSEESPRVAALLAHVRRVITTELAGEPLPWAYALFVGELGLDPGDVSYTLENTFSFGFARDVWAALTRDGETECFVVITPDRGEATQLARRFRDGFLAYGRATGAGGGAPGGTPGGAGRVTWIEDRHIGSVSGAVAHGRWVVGIRAAPHVERATEALAALVAGIDALPAEVVERAADSALPPSRQANRTLEPDG